MTEASRALDSPASCHGCAYYREDIGKAWGTRIKYCARAAKPNGHLKMLLNMVAPDWCPRKPHNDAALRLEGEP